MQKIDAQTVHRNARFHTLDAARPHASVLTVSGGRITAVGEEDLLDRISGDPEVVDHGGAPVLPGLGDVHNHHQLAGRADLFELQLDGNAALPDLLDTIGAWCADLGPDDWVIGGGWGSPLIPQLSDPNVLLQLDEAAGGRPVLLRDDSCHNRWVSSATLRRAGIDADSIDPPGGGVIRDPATRAPVGLLIEAGVIAAERAHAQAAPLTVEQDARASRRAIEILHSFGVVAFQDAAASLPLLRALRHLDDAGDLDAWVVTSAQVNDQIFGTDPVGLELIEQVGDHRSPHHRPDFVKIFLDGVPTSRTAAFLEPYLPDDEHGAGWTGETTMTAQELTGWLLEAARRGLGAKVHCTGDRSVRMLLDAVAEIRSAGFGRTRIHLAHGQYVADEDLPRMARLGVIADISPALWYPGVIVDAICGCIPRERAERPHPNRSLLDLGVLLAGGTDWPVMPSPNPWYGIQGLVSRADPSGRRPGRLWPEQAVTVTEAIAAHTIGAARAMGLDDVTGSLEPGKSADFVVLDRDPFEVAVDDLAATAARQTWFAGRKVFEA
jgi:predicted amidohydrolase YtcJ